MKRFLTYITSFVAFLYILALGMDYGISMKLQRSPDRRYQGWSKIINEQLNADLVVMGSSRAWVQYDPAILDSILSLNTYNLGIDGSGLNRQIAKYDVYNHYQEKNPNYIILNIDFFAAEEWSYGYEREQFFPFMWDTYVREEILRIEPMSWGERFIPLYRYVTYKGLYNVLRENPWDANTYKGYMGHERTWNPSALNDLTTYHFNVDERVNELFDCFLKERKNEGVNVIFCYAPIYVGFFEKVSNADDFFAYYKSKADQYDIPILDYTFSELSMDTTYFYNASHLNKQGAELFSTQLAKDLVKLQWINHK